MPETGFGGGSGPETSPRDVCYGAASVVRTLEISIANVKVTLTAPTDTSGDITLAYTLTNPRANPASIIAEYSTDNKLTWATATSAGGDSGTDSLATSLAGTAHTFEWDTVTDLGIDAKQDVYVRIRAYDLPIPPDQGDFNASAELKVSVDNCPLAPTLVTPADNWFDKDETPPFVCEIPDPKEGNSDMHVKIELDTVDTFDSDNYISFESRLTSGDTHFEYDSDGAGAWVDIPHAGIPIVATPALIGNQVRFNVPTPDKLPRLTYKWRMTFGGVL